MFSKGSGNFVLEAPPRGQTGSRKGFFRNARILKAARFPFPWDPAHDQFCNSSKIRAVRSRARQTGSSRGERRPKSPGGTPSALHAGKIKRDAEQSLQSSRVTDRWDSVLGVLPVGWFLYQHVAFVYCNFDFLVIPAGAFRDLFPRSAQPAACSCSFSCCCLIWARWRGSAGP